MSVAKDKPCSNNISLMRPNGVNAPVSSTLLDSALSLCGAYVYIWKTTTEKVGHVAIEVIDCESLPTDSSKQTGKMKNILKYDNNRKVKEKAYMSIHPGVIPSVGPTSILPVPASLSTSLSQDMEIEAEYENRTNISQEEPMIAISPPSSLSSASVKLLSPDFTFHVSDKIIDTNRMISFMKQEKDNVQNGRTAYQLFPKVDMMSIARDAPKCIGGDSAALIRKEATYRNKDDTGNTTPSVYMPRVYNCATLVTSILHAGGLKSIKNQAATPWGQSPNNVANQLFNISTTDKS